MITDKILFNLDRAQAAYRLYLTGRKYYQALRIYKANREIYSLLNEHAHLWQSDKTNTVINYIFHLEDWFAQFNYMVESRAPGLTDEFIFSRFEDSPAFSQDIYNVIRNIKPIP